MWHIGARKKNACRILLGKSEDKDSAESLYLRWNKSIR